jgi:hypothetical protein
MGGVKMELLTIYKLIIIIIALVLGFYLRDKIYKRKF